MLRIGEVVEDDGSRTSKRLCRAEGLGAACVSFTHDSPSQAFGDSSEGGGCPQTSIWSCEEGHGQIEARVGCDDGLPCVGEGGSRRRPFSRTKIVQLWGKRYAGVVELSRPLRKGCREKLLLGEDGRMLKWRRSVCASGERAEMGGTFTLGQRTTPVSEQVIKPRAPLQ